MENSKFTASDILEQPFDNDSNFSGSDSDGEQGEDVYILETTLSASALREEETLEDIFSGKWFYSESTLYLLLARQN